jgi:hypothetical protein
VSRNVSGNVGAKRFENTLEKQLDVCYNNIEEKDCGGKMRLTLICVRSIIPYREIFFAC